jgi:hypothetical protein
MFGWLKRLFFGLSSEKQQHRASISFTVKLNLNSKKGCCHQNTSARVDSQGREGCADDYGTNSYVECDDCGEEV